MSKSNEKKKAALGEAYGTARNKLIKNLLFKFMQDSGQDECFQCGCKIQTTREMSIEHKEPWLNAENSVELFYDLDNIAFSHLSCNSRAAARPVSKGAEAWRIQSNKNMRDRRAAMSVEERQAKRRKEYLRSKEIAKTGS
jgi:hypothetical protein